MPADEKEKELVQVVREREARIKELEFELGKAKEDYHEAVRDMHVQGMSLREIAALLKLSHQRVHQIVESQSQNWRFCVRPLNPQLACSFCESSSNQVEKLVAGPNIFMCNDCGVQCAKALKTGQPIEFKNNKFQILDKTTRLRCSFCGKLPGKQRAVIAARKHQVCSICLKLALQYMELE
jgi:hypothetical protein